MIKYFAVATAGLGLSTAAAAFQDEWRVFGGVDYMQTEVSVNRPIPPAEEGNLSATERLDADASAVRLRAGLWLGEDFTLEVQGAVSSEDPEAPDTGEIETYYGVFLSPRAQPFDWLDVMFPLGVAQVDTRIPDGDGGLLETSNESVAYGVNFQFKLGELLTDPDSIVAGLGLGAGFMVYDTSSDHNVRGYNGGLYFSYDF